MRKPRPVRRGFTLVELLVSCVILGLGLVALSQLYLASMWTYQKARYLSVATQRVQYEVEKVQNFKFNILKNKTHLISDTRYPASAGYTALPTNDGVGFVMDDLPDGRGKIVVSDFHGHSNLIQVEISIDWDEPQRSVSPVKIVTLLAK